MMPQLWSADLSQRQGTQTPELQLEFPLYMSFFEDGHTNYHSDVFFKNRLDTSAVLKVSYLSQDTNLSCLKMQAAVLLCFFFKCLNRNSFIITLLEATQKQWACFCVFRITLSRVQCFKKKNRWRSKPYHCSVKARDGMQSSLSRAGCDFSPLLLSSTAASTHTHNLSRGWGVIWKFRREKSLAHALMSFAWVKVLSKYANTIWDPPHPHL